MEKRERFAVEVLLGTVLVVLLILLIFLFTGVSGKTQTSTTITNSYNTNTNTYASAPSYASLYRPVATRPLYRDAYTKPYIVSDRYPYSAMIYYVKDDLRYTRPSDRYLRYDDFGEYRKVYGVLGNPINRYNVYVRNKDYTGGYFKVRFHFTDYYGRTSTESLTRYISPRKESRFVFKDISGNQYKYHDWWYEVIPQTKAPTRVYYNTGSPTGRIYAR